MNIDEAIKEHEKGAQFTWNGKPTVAAEECQQMVEWLKDYKRLLGAIEDIRAEIERHCSITVGSDNEPAMTLYDIFRILDKHISRKEQE